ncbi:sensor histidine kinase [Emticicia sp. W12TSBA100-4]|uniref:sensor histidine kinase n=1 Tax=Emticicia sp. W12TSBA100-4 TaxID=3160965 RepID=UPI00330650F0
MRKLIIFSLLILLDLCVYAQKEVFRLDGLPKEGILLNKGWKFHAGDNPDFAKPDFDDSKWESIDPTQDVMDLPQVKKAKIGYFRLSFSIDSSLVNKALALGIDQSLASEIYLNNALIHKIGVVSQEKEKEQIRLPNGQLFSIVFKNAGIQTICVRFSFVNPPILLKHKPKKYNAFKAQLVVLDTTIESFAKNKNNYALLDYLKVGLFLFLFLIHFFFFISYPKQKSNLYISLYALCNVIIYHLENLVSNLPLSAKATYIETSWIIILSTFIAILTFLIIYDFLKLPKKNMFWIGIVIFLLAYPICCYNPNFGIFYFNLVLAGFLAIESIRLSIKTIGSGKTAAWYIFAGYILYIVFLVVWYLIAFHVLPYSEFGISLFANLCLTSVPICFSLMLASEYTRTTKSLAQKLNEVENLSKEKQHILKIQNETLEKQNTELQAALLQGQTIERKRVAADLHDNLGSTLSALWLSVDMIDKSKMSEEESAIHQNLRQNLEKAYNDVRLLSHNLLPEELEKQGLSAALHYFIRKINQNSSIKFNLLIDDTLGKLDKKVEFELYSICLELVNNIIKHSKATEAMLRLHSATNDKIQLIIEDNGIGIFEKNSDGKGMKNVRARVESLNGTWNLQNIENKGVRSEVLIPV